jgi:hypothetical protein
MDTSFDIFRTDSEGKNVIWIESAGSLELAKQRVKEFCDSMPGDYLIFSKPSGQRTVVRCRPT